MIISHRLTQTNTDKKDGLQLYGVKHDKELASLFFVMLSSISPNVKTLGGPVSQGSQAILRSLIIEIM